LEKQDFSPLPRFGVHAEERNTTGKSPQLITDSDRAAVPMV